MKKYLVLLITTVLLIREADAQDSYTERTICTDWGVHKGKKNNGKKYCIGWATVREYKNGRSDTVSWFGGVVISEEDYQIYKNMSERGKYIIDSLKEDGIQRLNQSYLSYEPIYMKPGNKVETFWYTNGKDVFIYKYHLWKNNKGSGCRLLKQYKIN